MAPREQDQNQGQRPEQNTDDPPAGGINQPSQDRPEDPKEVLEPPTDNASWGHLPRSLDFLKHRGGSPTVPERYRKFREAFLKQGQQTDKNK
jgi:hypothetical protein